MLTNFLSEILQKNTFNVVYLNMDGRLDRFENMEKMLTYLGVHYARFPAVEGKKFFNNKTYLSEYNHASRVRLDHDKLMQKNVTRMSNNQVGCFLSHLLVLLEIAAANTTRPTIVLEDDVDLDKNFVSKFLSALESVPNDWDLLLCGYCCKRIERKVNYFLLRMKFHLATHCLVIRNSTTAEKLVKHINVVQLDFPVDNMIGEMTRNKSLNVYGMRRKIAIQKREFYKSDILSKDFPKERLKGDSLLEFLKNN